MSEINITSDRLMDSAELMSASRSSEMFRVERLSNDEMAVELAGLADRIFVEGHRNHILMVAAALRLEHAI